jgi:hypothetical protein
MPSRSPKPAKTKKTAIISSIRNNLLASPNFSIFYAAVLADAGVNPNLAKNLAEGYQKKIGAPMPSQSMSTESHSQPTRFCTHIKVTGTRCGAPSLRGEQFCYFHQRMVRGVRTPPKARIHPIANLEDDEAIQASLMEVMNAIVRNTIDLRRAELLIRALNAAVRNARRARLGAASAREMVKEIPEYAAPPEPPKPEPAPIVDARKAYGHRSEPEGPPSGSEEIAQLDAIEATLRKRPRSAAQAHAQQRLREVLTHQFPQQQELPPGKPKAVVPT